MNGIKRLKIVWHSCNRSLSTVIKLYRESQQLGKFLKNVLNSNQMIFNSEEPLQSLGRNQSFRFLFKLTFRSEIFKCDSTSFWRNSHKGVWPSVELKGIDLARTSKFVFQTCRKYFISTSKAHLYGFDPGWRQN